MVVKKTLSKGENAGYILSLCFGILSFREVKLCSKELNYLASAIFKEKVGNIDVGLLSSASGL